MDNTGLLPSADVFYSPPMKHRLQGQLPSAAGALIYGGLPSDPRGSEPSGDAGEGLDLPLRVQRVDDNDPGYKPHPNLPSATVLDYVHKASSATLLVLALLLLIVYGLLRPRRALRLLEGRAGGGL